MYVLCIVGGVESVKGDIDVCFVYCWGLFNRYDVIYIYVCFLYCWGV